MFEIWEDAAQPAVRLVLKAGSDMPAELGFNDWTRVGPFTPDPATAQEIGEKGYAFLKTDSAASDALG